MNETSLEGVPSPASVAHLEPRDAVGLALVGGTTLVSVAGIELSTEVAAHFPPPFWRPAIWTLGQLLLGLAFVQWFILLHEAGHGTLFRTRVLNVLAGHVAGFLSGFPYLSWKYIHRGHHRWTGWQDRDATTASLTKKPECPALLQLVNVCWRFWIPLFAVAYRIGNYWNYWRIRPFLPADSARRGVAWNIALYAVVYVVLLFAMFDPIELLATIWLGLLLSLVAQEFLLLSQHTHIPSNVAAGRNVTPFSPLHQEAFTRSLRVPEWFSRYVLFHFDRHELHHMYVRVPAWDLCRIPYRTRNDVSWWAWLVTSKRLPGETFFYSNRKETGFEL